MLRRLILTLALSLTPLAASVSNIYSIEQELAMGRQMAAEVEKQAKIVDDPLIAEYINRLGQNIAREANAPFPVVVRLIQSDEVDAFTLPGGYVYINTGMLLLSDNEAELVSVLAHEIGHAAARHSTRIETRSKWASLAAAVPGVFLGGWKGIGAAQAGSQVAAPMASFYFSRSFEKEADRLGVNYLVKAGYDPNASIDMFERIESIQKRQPGTVSKLFSTHPPTADRITATQKTIQDLKEIAGDLVLNTSEYEGIRTRVKNLPR